MALPGKQKAPWQEEAGFRLQKALADRAQAPLCLRCCVGGGGGLRSPLGSPPLLPPPQHPPWGWHRLQSREHGGAEEDPGASQGQPEAGPHCVFSATRPSF